MKRFLFGSHGNNAAIILSRNICRTEREYSFLSFLLTHEYVFIESTNLAGWTIYP